MDEKPKASWTKAQMEKYKKDFDIKRRKALGLDKPKPRFSKETVDEFTKGFTGGKTPRKEK